jgi:hypothetical protein
MPKKRPAEAKANPDGPKVLIADTVSDGRGGYLAVGASVEAPAATIESLKEKGLIG